MEEAAKANLGNMEAAMREQLRQLRANETGSFYDDVMGDAAARPSAAAPAASVAAHAHHARRSQASITRSTGASRGFCGCSASTPSSGCLRS